MARKANVNTADKGAQAGNDKNDDVNIATVDAAPKTPSKNAKVIELLSREQGATLEELTDATGWQPHSTRAVLTGLRKKGHQILREKRGDVTFYRIAQAEAG